jgi:hypothetical protein
MNTAFDPTTAEKLVYQAPELLDAGDVRDVTLGGSVGTGDSGNPGAQQP